MLLFLVSLAVLLWPSTGNYADDLGLQCSSVYTVEKPKLKKTKVWKKCHDSNKELLTCLEKGLKVKEVGALVDEEELLCEYIVSRDHVVHFTERTDKGRAGLLKKYLKGKEFKDIVEDLKMKYVEVTGATKSAGIIEDLRVENKGMMDEARVQSYDDLTSLFESMVNLTTQYGKRVEEKSLNILLDYEDVALKAKDWKLPLHLNRGLELGRVGIWTTLPWTAGTWTGQTIGGDEEGPLAVTRPAEPYFTGIISDFKTWGMWSGTQNMAKENPRPHTEKQYGEAGYRTTDVNHPNFNPEFDFQRWNNI